MAVTVPEDTNTFTPSNKLKENKINAVSTRRDIYIVHLNIKATEGWIIYGDEDFQSEGVNTALHKRAARQPYFIGLCKAMGTILIGFEIFVSVPERASSLLQVVLCDLHWFIRRHLAQKTSTIMVQTISICQKTKVEPETLSEQVRSVHISSVILPILGMNLNLQKLNTNFKLV